VSAKGSLTMLVGDTKSISISPVKTSANYLQRFSYGKGSDDNRLIQVQPKMTFNKHMLLEQGEKK